MLRRLLQPRVLIPGLIMVGILVFLAGYTDIYRVWQLMLSFPPSYIWYVLLLMGVYEGLRFLQWRLFLQALQIPASRRQMLFSFMGGEVAKALPGGSYFQNYLLRQSQGTAISFSAAATSTVLLLEIVVCLTALLIFGIPAWPWLRPAIMLFALLTGLLFWWFVRGGLWPWLLHNQGRHGLLGKVAGYLERFAAGARDLWHWPVLSKALGLTAVYLFSAGIILYLITQGFGLASLSFSSALAVYGFSLACGLLIPIPVDLGLIELSGLSVFLAFGVDKNEAFAVLITLRILTNGASLLISSATMLLLKREFSAAINNKPQPSS